MVFMILLRLQHSECVTSPHYHQLCTCYSSDEMNMTEFSAYGTHQQHSQITDEQYESINQTTKT